MTDRASAEGLRDIIGAFEKHLNAACSCMADECCSCETGEPILASLRALRDTGPRPDSGIDAPECADRHELLELCRLIVSYADLTHDVVRDPNGDWRDIAKEWGVVVDRARANLDPYGEYARLSTPETSDTAREG